MVGDASAPRMVRFPSRASLLAAVSGLAVLLASSAAGQQPAAVSGRANNFFKNRQYVDCLKALQEEIQGKDEAVLGRHFLMLGECHYLTEQIETARPYFAKAERALPDGREKMLAHYRIASCLYRLNDLQGAQDRIDSFLAKYPGDPAVGKLLIYKMLILSKRGKDAEAEITRLHQQIRQNIQKYEHTTGMEADQILCDYYRKIGDEEKALGVYSRIVQNFRNVIAELRADGKPIPSAYEKAHDNAALQLGAMYIDKKQPGEAVKWLENVRYDMGMKQKSRLLLAKLAYERRDFNSVVAYLTEQNFMDSVPAGPMKSDMYLLLGLAEKGRPDGEVGRVELWLRQVDPAAKGFPQAQSALADTYRDKGLFDQAIKCYSNVVGLSEYAANAHFSLGAIYLDVAARKVDPGVQQSHYRRAADHLNLLLSKYPLSPYSKAAREKAQILVEKGFEIASAKSDEDNIKTWQQTAQQKAGTVEGAQALMSVMRTHMRAVTDEKTGRFLKAPNYVAAAATCARLLDARVYDGKGFDAQNWKALRGEVLYVRGQCEIASVAPPREDSDQAVKPLYLPQAQADAAIAFFEQARQAADPKQLDLIKGIDLGTLESLFKSSKRENRDLAEQRFQQWEADYGSDPKFQRLALDLARWYEDQKRLADAARQYSGIADRGKTFPMEDRLRLRYQAGTLYSRAAFDSLSSRTATNYAVYIYPREVVDLVDDLRKSYDPLQRTIEVPWPAPAAGSKDIAAAQALVALSHAARIPFVWSPAKGPGTVASYLEEKRLLLAPGPTTVDKALAAILDFKSHRLTFDIGLTGGTPTLEKPKMDADDPEMAQAWKVLEIYDVGREDDRYAPLTRVYGRWNDLHRGQAVLLFTILTRIETLTNTRFVWADGIEKQDRLAEEFRELPGLDPSTEYRCSQVLNSALKRMTLRWRVIERNAAADLYEAAKDQFNKIRQESPRSKFGERSLYALAVNYYNQQDYDRMRVVLREYLKLFDNPSHEFYRQACFWIGWVFENQKRYREACDFYARAAEERLIVYKLGADAKPPAREALKSQLSYDTQFALMEPVAGEFKARTLPDLVDFVRVNAHVELRIDATAQGLTNTVSREAFKQVPVFDVLADAVDALGLSFRAENVEPEVAEKAYFRMAAAYKKDNLMSQALENCQALLARYPKTARRRETYRLMLDIYKGLKDYRNVLSVLEEWKKLSGDDIEKYQIEYEIGSIFFDMADYGKAAGAFRNTLAAARSGTERVRITDALAKALFREGRFEDALPHFEALEKQESESVAQFADRMSAFVCRFLIGKAEAREFPADALKFLQKYEQLPEDERNRLSPSQFTLATWIYYAQALIDLKRGDTAAALPKLNAVTRSPDDFLAADAGYRLGRIHLEAREYEKAREVLEYTLFATRAPDSAVRATYALALTYKEMNRPEKALERFLQVVDRYPLAPFVESIRQEPVYLEWQARSKGAKPVAPAGGEPASHATSSAAAPTGSTARPPAPKAP